MIILITMLGLSGLWFAVAKKTDAKGIIARPLDDRNDYTRYLPRTRREDPIRDLGWAMFFIALLFYFAR